jgi:hypothetical protein
MNTQHSHTTPWRWPAAAALSTTAAIHIALVPAHLREAPYAGVLFIALAAGALVLALVLLIRCDPRAWIAAAGLAAMAAGAYVFSRSVGLPAMADDVGDWLNPLGVAAVASELAVITIAVRVLSGRPRHLPPKRAMRSLKLHSWRRPGPAAAAQPRRISSTGPGTSPARSPSV